MNEKNPSFKHYGLRGISICKEWVDNYDQFFADMGKPPDGHSLERIDNDLGYSPANCKWATVEEQLNNQRRNIKLTFAGKTQTASQWAKELHIPYARLSKRVSSYGMPAEVALSQTTLRSWSHGTRAGYEGHGCRCDACRESNNERYRSARARRKEAR